MSERRLAGRLAGWLADETMAARRSAIVARRRREHAITSRKRARLSSGKSGPLKRPLEQSRRLCRRRWPTISYSRRLFELKFSRRVKCCDNLLCRFAAAGASLGRANAVIAGSAKRRALWPARFHSSPAGALACECVCLLVSSSNQKRPLPAAAHLAGRPPGRRQDGWPTKLRVARPSRCRREWRAA